MSYFTKQRSLGHFHRSRSMGDDTSTPAVDLSTSMPDDQSTASGSSTSTSFDTSVTSAGSTIGGGIASSSGVAWSPGSPQGAWQNVSGICYPTTTASGNALLAQLKEMQRQANRVLSQSGAALLGVDGKVGPATLSALGTIAGPANFASLIPSGIATCDQVCQQAANITAAIQIYADSLGASSSVASPSAPVQQWQPPSVKGGSGSLVGQPTTADLLDAWNNLGTTEKLGIGGVALAALYFWKKSSKRRGR